MDIYALRRLKWRLVHGGVAAIENPGRSWLWGFDLAKELRVLPRRCFDHRLALVSRLPLESLMEDRAQL